jgi:hypothetical protein
MMNRIYLVILLCICVFTFSTAQESDEFRTVFPKVDREENPLRITGLGGPMMQFTSIDNNFVHMMGGGGAILINNFYLGGYGMGITNNTPYKNQEEEYNLGFGHGGFWMGYVFKPYSPIHLDLSAMIGGGSISRKLENNNFDDQELDGESVFVLTPVAEVQFNFSRLFRLGVGTSFSYVTGAGISRTAYTVSDFLKPAVFLSFKFGYFY